ncbi:glycosyltransferase family 4 protein [Singulisphaera acidiphila]|uniref:Glycosyltransferase n=1 Tax=Singulisphaera acidiphila (strain ATCC BAA-1392 / DSM 18658 / VKM B-2454 / MOB10) TaxID=886293 RepID=L0DJ15_SINAD|nr:glycosyltransferase family 4 protein [Singulisphaera acidiphila]AGA28661.1 glycosyltransferase [Singulisphaera acidiphila DSM 18658]
MGYSRILFASCHGYVDPSSGAAISTRELMELFAARGIDARVLSTGVLDYNKEKPLKDVLDRLNVPYRTARASLAGAHRETEGGTPRGVEVYDLQLDGVRVTLMPTASSRSFKAPSATEAAAFLDLADQVFERFRPQVMLTYGGPPIGRELIVRARRRGIAVVFHLRNFQYSSRSLFEEVSGIVVTTEYARRHYAEVLGRDCKVIPNPLRPDRVVAADRQPRYLTFVNPSPNKGLLVFARIAVELDRRRPDIPLLVVEGRGTADGLGRVMMDMSGLRNLHRMANTPDPRDFYRVTRAVLMPSLCRESFGRVAAEALANGIPVLGSDRGALPETIGEGGFVLPIPERYTPASVEIPTAEEVEPWIAIIERLWDDPEWEAAQGARALASAGRWDEGEVANEYQAYFESLGASVGSSGG